MDVSWLREKVSAVLRNDRLGSQKFSPLSLRGVYTIFIHVRKRVRKGRNDSQTTHGGMPIPTSVKILAYTRPGSISFLAGT